MEIRHLRYFVAVAEALNFTKAAAKLHLAQPSLTRQIRDLEEELGVPLFDRSKNRISLTEGGRVFLREARQLVAQCAACVQAVQQLAGRAACQLSIGYIADSFPDTLPAILQAFRHEFPQAELHLFNMNVAEQYRALEEGDIDLGFIDLPPQRNGIEFCCAGLGKLSILAAVSTRDPLAKSERIPLRSLEPRFFVERSEKSFPGACIQLVQMCRSAGFNPRILHEVENDPAKISFVAKALGVALMPQQRQTMLEHNGVVFRPLEPQVTTDSYVIWRAENDSHYLNRWLEMVIKLSSSNCHPMAGRQKAEYPDERHSGRASGKACINAEEAPSGWQAPSGCCG